MIASTRFGAFGGVYVPEILVRALEQLEAGWLEATEDPAFQGECDRLLRTWAGRPTPLDRCRRFGVESGGEVWLKREDLLHGGAHKTTQALGQALLARRLGKRRLIAETGAGQHGVATAMAGAVLGLDVTVYMGARDMARQAPNVERMRLFGARVVPVTTGSATLKDAINEALREWSARYDDTHYLLGTAAGPHPFPRMVRDFQRVIGDEARRQCLADHGRLPDAVVACVGGGSNAIGIFTAFLADPVALIGVEPAGRGLESGAHGATLQRGSPGILHGAHTYVLQDGDGLVKESHSISAGLDYPAVGPEHAWLQSTGRARYIGCTDADALATAREFARAEGILPALESAHALAGARALVREGLARVVLVNLSGRGDKDLATLRHADSEDTGAEDA